MISYYLPPSNENSSKIKLLETIEYLSRSGIDDGAFKVLNALAEGLLWSEESDTAVRKLGLAISQELYDHATQNADYEACLADRENPANWKI